MIGGKIAPLQRGQVIALIEQYIDELPTLERYTGVTDGSGNYSVTYSPAKSATPLVAPILTPATANNISFRVTASSNTGFTVKVEQRNSINLLGSDVLLSDVSNAASRNVDVLVVEF